MCGKQKTGREDSHFPTANRCADPEKRWYVFYLRPRSEKIVLRDLTNLGYEVFLPTNQLVRVWRNRQKKKIEVPLFPNYIFVFTCAHELYQIKCQPKIATYVSLGGKPATIKMTEIEGIRQMLSQEQEVLVETKFIKGQHVRIVSGPLAGYEGTLTRRNGKNRFGIALKAINQTALIDIDVSTVEKIAPK